MSKNSFHGVVEGFSDEIGSLLYRVSAVASALRGVSSLEVSAWPEWDRSEVVSKVCAALEQRAYLVSKLQSDGMPIESNPLVCHLDDLAGQTARSFALWKNKCGDVAEQLEAVAAQYDGTPSLPLASRAVEVLGNEFLSSVNLSSVPEGEFTDFGFVGDLNDLCSALEDRISDTVFLNEDEVKEYAQSYVKEYPSIDLNSLPDFFVINWEETTERIKKQFLTEVKVGPKVFFYA